MSLRDIAVILDDSPQSARRLELAIALARRNDAHLSGIYPPALSRTVQARDRAGSIEAGFREQLRRNELTGYWKAPADETTAATVSLVRATDLVVIGQVDPEHPSVAAARALVHDVLMLSGRPLLIVPFAGHFETLGQRVLIGWTDAGASARAVADSLPLIDAAAKVTVLTVREPRGNGWPDVPGAAIARHLARHGLDATAAQTVTDQSISDADALLNYASDMGADLLVTGGYGHSRTREAVLGGVTRTLLQHMTVPVLMSH